MKKLKTIIGNRSGKRFVARNGKKVNYRNVHFIMLAVVLPVHTTQGVINYPKGGKLKIAAHASGISAACATSTWVTIPLADITFVNTQITNYSTANSGNRPGKKKLMTDAIEEKLLNPFQTAANADPINSISILESGGFHVKLQAIPQIHGFEVENGATMGMVEIKTAGGPRGKVHLHNWYSSTDGITFKWEKSTNSANTQLGPYTSGVKMYFKTELSVLDVLQGLSQTIDIRIK